MSKLTLEQIEEGERLIESAQAGWVMPDGTKVTGGLEPLLAQQWLIDNAPALLAAAKRVAFEDTTPSPYADIPISLTISDCTEGRRLSRAAKYGDPSYEEFKIWLVNHAGVLIAAAECVTRWWRQAPTPGDPPAAPPPVDLALDHARIDERHAERLADERNPFYRLRAAAAEQLGIDPTLPDPLTDQIEPEVAAVHAAVEAAQQELERVRDEQRRKAAPVVAALQAEASAEFFGRPLVGRGRHVTNPHAIGPELIEAWYHSRGVVVRADIHTQDPKNVVIDPVKLVEGHGEQRRPHLQEQPDGHTMVWVR